MHAVLPSLLQERSRTRSEPMVCAVPFRSIFAVAEPMMWEEPRRAESLEALAAQCDILSLHVPGGEATRHLVGAELLSLMPRHALLVNTARGSVVDEAALAEALAAGRIAGVGLDVYEREPVVHPGLLAHPRAVLLPHLGSATIEARTAMGMRAVANLDAFFRGEAPGDRVA